MVPQYSQAAQSVRKKFLKLILHCYVEAAEDKLFWKTAVNLNCNKFTIKFYEAGDCKRIDKIIESILSGNKTKIAIRDSDYLGVDKAIIKHPRVIYTFGYSLENSLYTPANIAKAINCLAVVEKASAKRVDAWLRQCFEELKELIILDIADMKSGKGVGVLGDSGAHYLDNDKVSAISTEKTSKRLKEVENKFSSQEKEVAYQLVNQFRKRKYLLIRGHLMTHLVVNFANREIDRYKPTGKKGKLNRNSIYGHMLGQVNDSTLYTSELVYIKRKLREIHKEFGL